MGVAAGTLILSAQAAAPLTSATISEARNSVSYQSNATAARPAKTGDVVKETDVVRTGERSLAELEFNDKTITRLGSMSIFSFNAATRVFNIERGLAVICMPKGSGGGKIVGPALTAAIEGTTVVVWNDAIIFLEGTGTITTRDGKQSKRIHGGQIAQLINGVLTISDVDLGPLLQSRLLKGRPEPLPTWALILDVAKGQQDALNSGALGIAPPPETPPGTPGIDEPSYQNEGLNGVREKRTPPPPPPPPQNY